VLSGNVECRFAWKVVNPYGAKFYMNLQFSVRNKIPTPTYLFSSLVVEPHVGSKLTKLRSLKIGPVIDIFTFIFNESFI